MMRRNNKQSAKPEVVAQVRLGLPLKDAAYIAGVSPGTVTKWRKRDKAFDQQIRKAMAAPNPPSNWRGTIKTTASDVALQMREYMDRQNATSESDQLQINELMEQAQDWRKWRPAPSAASEVARGAMRSIANEADSIAKALSGSETFSYLLDPEYAHNTATRWRTYADDVGQNAERSEDSRQLAQAAHRLAEQYEYLASKAA